MDSFVKARSFNKITKLVSGLLGVALLFTVSISFASIALAYNIVILTSKSAAPYNSFVKEFKKVLPGSSVKVLNMDGDVTKGNVLIEKVAESKTDLIVALGPRAAWVVKNKQDVPIIFSMLSNHKKYDLDGRTGIRSEFSLQQQLQTFKEIIPNIKKIGLLYNKNNASEIKIIEKIAKDVDIEIVKKEINDVREVGVAVDDLLMHIDALWLRKDQLITGNARLLKQVVLLRALRKKIPIIGDNKWTVQNGALFCLFASYQSIGAQAGEMAERMISEGELGFLYPLNVNVFFNPHVAERLAPGIDIVVPRDAFFVK